MKYLFIVQGEGHGHLTQALALEQILTARGHEIVEVLVGESPTTAELPPFFLSRIQAPVSRFFSPGIELKDDRKRGNLLRSALQAGRHLPRCMRSMRRLKQHIERSGADAVVNFYEVICGLTYLFLAPSVPQVCIAHQYLFLHPQFAFPLFSGRRRLRMLRFFTRLTCLEATECLALSFYPLPPDEKGAVHVVPPLLRSEVLNSRAAEGDYVHGYMLNAGFVEELLAWHKTHPQVRLQFYRRDPEALQAEQVDDTLVLLQPDGPSFLRSMAGCMAYATTAGFESVCEAIFLGKPVLMVPTHVEQECNAFDAARYGAGIISDSFDLSPLLDFVRDYRPHTEFPAWARSAGAAIAARLERVAALSVQQRKPGRPASSGHGWQPTGARV